MKRFALALAPWIVGAVLLAAAPETAPSREELLWHHRNLGKAFYENPTTQYQAVTEFKAALDLAPDSVRERVNYGLALLKAGKTAEGVAELEKAQKQDPSIPHTWFNLGIAYKRDADYERSIAQFSGMIERVPDEPVSHYNLGALYKLTGKPDLALRHFEEAARLAPGLAGPHFQLYNTYKATGRAEEAKREYETFQAIRKRQEGAVVPEDLEWSWYSEIYEEPDPEGAAAPPVPPKWQPRELGMGMNAPLVVLDADGDGRPDLLAGNALFRNGTARVEASGLRDLKGIEAVAPGDFDNDGLPDLYILSSGAPALYRNAGGRFEKATVQMPQFPAGRFSTAVWLDFDHDYDLDLILLGDGAALLRNEGTAGFADETKRFPFVLGKAVAAASLHVISDTQGADLAVAYADRPGTVYRDRLGGTFEAVAAPELPAGAAPLIAFDANGDGWTDLAAGSSLLVNGRGKAWTVEKAPAPPYAPADLDNRGKTALASAPVAASALAAADFDGDGRVDLATLGKDGKLTLFRNATETPNHWLAVRLEGVKNLKLAPGAEIEVKSGRSYQKKLYRGTPVVFGLGGREQADTVRITWPNGLIQNETRQAAGRLTADLAVYKEAPRLSGSCPMIFTWNGERFQFITDVLGVAPLGASAGDGEYFPVDHDEFIQIPGEALAAVDGRYEIRVTEELREVAYLDQVRLIAVDHPKDVEIFTNDKFKGPPFPEFRLFGVERKVRPVAARDAEGRDVLDRVLARDQRYPDGFKRTSAGVAELHHLDLDFGDRRHSAPDGRAVLVLSGWVDWADGSTFLGAAQEADGGLVMPRLQVKDAEGRWVTVIDDMGIPAGKPKTIAVDLTGKFLSASREVRIETSLCVYWDEIFLSEETGEPATALSDLPPATAELRFRGFSRPVIHPERKQPESFDYQTWMPLSMWNPTPGLYTRYGDVRPLLTDVDDRMVVMGSGDEVRFLFDARMSSGLPALPDGWRRDFLLKVDGWAKDADANTAFSQTVEPLPFHGMSRYPYPAGEKFPDDGPHRLYREHYNTRPALRLIRPLVPR
jgi:tetratricopeptide (TPR) repeat protein